MKPLLTLQNRPFPEVFRQVLDYHLSNRATIWDATPGERLSWQKYDEDCKMNKVHFFKLNEYKILEIPKRISVVSNSDFNYQYVYKPVDAIFFDPPYIFGVKEKTADEREGAYGEYCHTFDDIRKIIKRANKNFPTSLKPDGKLFFKYTDVFSLSERKFYHCASIWPKALSAFEIIDHYIIQHHHLSPTAWQVKDRPCGIVNYTYLTIFKLK